MDTTDRVLKVERAPLKIVEKLWGTEIWKVNLQEANYCLKELIVIPNRTCSLHFHRDKSESFLVTSGRIMVEINNKEYELMNGDVVHIAKGTNHRFYIPAHWHQTCHIDEVSNFHSDDDVVRLTGSDIWSEAVKKMQWEHR